MTIKNSTNIAGGIDWVVGETLEPEDLNDTFNKIKTIVDLGN